MKRARNAMKINVSGEIWEDDEEEKEQKNITQDDTRGSI